MACTVGLLLDCFQSLLLFCRSILRACNNLGRLDERVSNAVKTRQEVDLRIGKMGGGGKERMESRE